MRKIAMLFIVLMSLASLASAETLDTIAAWSENFDLYGFASMEGPSKADSTYNFNWVRLGFKARPHGKFIENYLVRFEYDLTKETLKEGLKYAYVEKEFDNGFTATGGQQLSSTQAGYPGPSSLRLTRWPDAEHSGMNVYVTGFGLKYKTEGKDVFRVINYGKNNWVASITSGPITAYWENEIAYGAVVEHSFNEWVNPFVGVTNYDGRISEHPTNVFLQNYFQLGDYWRLYVQYDVNENEEDAWLVGFTGEYAENCFLKVYYDERDDFLRVKFTYSF